MRAPGCAVSDTSTWKSPEGPGASTRPGVPGRRCLHSTREPAEGPSATARYVPESLYTCANLPDVPGIGTEERIVLDPSRMVSVLRSPLSAYRIRGDIARKSNASAWFTAGNKEDASHI